MPGACLAGVARASCAHGAGLRGPPATLSGRPFWKVILRTPHHRCCSCSSNSLRDAEPRLAQGSPWGSSERRGTCPCTGTRHLGPRATPRIPSLTDTCCCPFTAVQETSPYALNKLSVNQRFCLLPELCRALKTVRL